jgi:hypothetical protein
MLSSGRGSDELDADGAPIVTTSGITSTRASINAGDEGSVGGNSAKSSRSKRERPQVVVKVEDSSSSSSTVGRYSAPQVLSLPVPAL